MQLNLTQKERMLLEDEKSHEQLCIDKYTNYANETNDAQLKQILLNNAEAEKQHFNTLNQMLNGQIPDLNASQNSNQQSNTNIQQQPAGMMNVSDQEICKDLLMDEKYVSSTYDTAIFEFRDPNARDVLNHIQKEEQQHGQAIYQYMESKGMYNPQ